MSKRSAPEWLTRFTYAHRGLHSPGIVENSRNAMEEAIAAGFGIECDVQMSSDNVPLVFHDWELDRLTAESGAVAARPADALCKIGLSGGRDRIWTLTNLLELVDGRAPILVEVKSLPGFDIATACAAIEAAVAGYGGPIAVMSFDPRMGEWFAKESPEFPRGLVCTDTLDLGFLSAWRQPDAIERAQPDFLAFDVRDLPNPEVEEWRESGRPVLTWTVRTADLRAKATAFADAAIAEGEGIRG